jgi:hypothetical protein
MIRKRMLVLANSTKHYPMRCVAGRELSGEAGTAERWGPWIRPVSAHDECALDFSERKVEAATDPKPLDIVWIPLERHENSPLQPENWIIAKGERWTKESTTEPEAITSLVEEPESLWLDPSQKSDRATESFLTGLPDFQSLYLIRPESFQFHIRSRVWEGYAKKQLRGLFSYRGRHYDFALTDPLIGQKYFPDYPRTPEGYVQPSNRKGIVICISLTPPFHDLHYKVIATVFEMPS